MGRPTLASSLPHALATRPMRVFTLTLTTSLARSSTGDTTSHARWLTDATMLPVTDIHSALRDALPPAPAHFWTARDDAAHTVVVVVPNSQAATIALSLLTEFSVTHASLGELTFSVNATPNGPRSPDVLCFGFATAPDDPAFPNPSAALTAYAREHALPDGGRPALAALLTRAVDVLHEVGTQLFRRSDCMVEFLIHSEAQREEVMRLLDGIRQRSATEDLVDIYHPVHPMSVSLAELLSSGAIWHQAQLHSSGAAFSLIDNPWRAELPDADLPDAGPAPMVISSPSHASSSGAAHAPAAPQPSPPRLPAPFALAAQAGMTAAAQQAAAAAHQAAASSAAAAEAAAAEARAAGAPQGGAAPLGVPPPATPQPWTTVGRPGARRAPASRSESESWSPALDPHLWGTSRATALITDLEIRLVITGIPDFWDPISVGDFFRALGFMAACITAVTVKRPANKPPMAFVNVTDQATADAMVACSGTKQANSGEPPIMIAAAHKPGVCSACGAAGHTQKKCVQCKHCRAWGHAAVLCPIYQSTRRGQLAPHPRPGHALAKPGADLARRPPAAAGH